MTPAGNVHSSPSVIVRSCGRCYIPAREDAWVTRAARTVSYPHYQDYFSCKPY